jgi:hypothetical protein
MSTDVSEERVTSISRAKNKPSKKLVSNRQQEELQAGLCMGLFCNPKDRDDMFLQNIKWLSMDYIVLHPRR